MHLTESFLSILVGLSAVTSMRIHLPHFLFPLNSTIAHYLADQDEPQCHSIDAPTMPGLTPTNCGWVADVVCYELTQSSARDKWIWNERPGCAIGFWMPQRRYVDIVNCPQILKSIIAKCAFNSKYNAGTVNVAELPDFSQDGSSEHHDRVAWLLAPERLTL
ncbi:MAG: hypothetical protein L6R40_004617 [Gallowayella cf. fulva]|nr:MAG: hypothetical protein L6R40_004617 [Xanthomendoza cf. fulva]